MINTSAKLLFVVFILNAFYFMLFKYLRKNVVSLGIAGWNENASIYILNQLTKKLNTWETKVVKIKHTRNENDQNFTYQNKTTLFWRKKAKINLHQNFQIYGMCCCLLNIFYIHVYNEWHTIQKYYSLCSNGNFVQWNRSPNLLGKSFHVWNRQVIGSYRLN